MPTWREFLGASGLPRLEAQCLATLATGQKRSWLLAHDGDPVDPALQAVVQPFLMRRLAGEPLAYILGEREFFGLEFSVTPDVLIPRPETELLVELACAWLPADGRLMDIGTGSGAIAVAIARNRPDVEVSACDISANALAVARANADRHGVRIRFGEGDLFDAFGPGTFDVVVSNPPYVATGDPHLTQGDLRFEPAIALEAAEGGLAVIQRLADASRDHLVAGGMLFFEHGHEQGPTCVALLQALGYRDVTDYNDLSGLSRVTRGQWMG